MKKIKIVLILLFIINLNSIIFADDHTKEEINNLIATVESSLETIKGTDAEDYAGAEIALIEEYIKMTKKYLIEGDEDKAYYEISIGKTYFQIIDAKIDLHKVEKELEELNKKLNQ